jgi:HSP20 family protein
MERSYGAFERNVELPCEVDRERVQASFKKGVLSITLPKTVEAQKASRKIAVRAG